MSHEVDLEGEITEFDWPHDMVLLEALEAAGVVAPHSCRMGECGACTCVVEGGGTHMKANKVLSNYDINDGLRLACQTLQDENNPPDTRFEISYDCW